MDLAAKWMEIIISSTQTPMCRAGERERERERERYRGRERKNNVINRAGRAVLYYFVYNLVCPS
jgi:hypothetical protein